MTGKLRDIVAAAADIAAIVVKEALTFQDRASERVLEVGKLTDVWRTACNNVKPNFCTGAHII